MCYLLLISIFWGISITGGYGQKNFHSVSYSYREKPAITAIKVVGNSKSTVLKLFSKHGEKFSMRLFLDKVYSELEGVPYGGGGEGLKQGQLLINFEKMDCVTFIEQVWALLQTNLMISQSEQPITDEQKFNYFVKKLNEIRYYEGKNEVWEDRIHYFTDALYRLKSSGKLQDIASKYGVPFTKKINYLSSNRNKFKGFTNWNRIIEIERRLSSLQRFYIPLEDVPKYDSIAKDGDIIALATNVEGLDVSHCGIVTFKYNEVKFTHASSTRKKVVIEESLCDYLNTRNTITGIFVFRPVLP